MAWKRIIAVTSIALVCLATLLALDRFSPFAYVRARNLLRDAITRAGRTTPPNPDLVFLAIDSESVNLDEENDVDGQFGLAGSDSTEAKTLRLMSKRWPWPREVYGLVLERLVQAGAKVVLFDLLFPKPSDGDEPFRLALDHYRDRVVIGSDFVMSTWQDERDLGASPSRPTESLVLQTTPMDDRVGYTNFWPDDDDVVRRVQFHLVLGQLGDRPLLPDDEQFLSFGARALIKAGYADRVPMGLSDRIFRYTGPPGRGFVPHSIFSIFVPSYWKGNFKSGEFFRGKMVLIGPQGNWQHDEHATPFGSMPGPELHLNAINAAIHGEFIHELSASDRLFITFITALLGIAISLRIRSPWLRLAGLGAVNGLIVLLALQAYNYLAAYVPCLAPLVQINVTVLFGLVCDFAWERLEKKRVRRMLDKYVSTNVVRELLDHSAEFQQSLGGVVKPVAILFSDIRGYTIISAQTDPHALVAQLNEYLTAMVECVFRYGGTLDKFIGDALMAVWGNVKSDGMRVDTANAVRAALAMREELERLNQSWRQRGLSELRIGIAVNQGDVVVGNIGSAQRMEFTVIGDVVNISWKLQELTKKLEANILVSKSVSALLIEDFELHPLGRATVAGHADFEVYSVVGPVDVSATVPGRGDLLPA